MAVISNLIKTSDIPEIVDKLTQITQYRHSIEDKTFGEILNEELKKIEENERGNLNGKYD